MVDSPEELERFAPGWDALAVAARRPYCAPAWLLAWWRHVAPPHARLRTVVVFDADGAVAAVAPYFAQRAPAGFTEYRLLGSGTASRLSPLARAGTEAAAAVAIARELAAASPRARAIRFEGTDRASPWPQLLARAWPGRLRPWDHRDIVHPAPIVTLSGRSFDEWLATRSANFRQQMRRTAAKAAAAGATARMTVAGDDLDGDVAAFVRLHMARWSGRGGSGTVIGGVEEMLRDAGRALLVGGRFRLWSLELGGEAIAAQLFVAAGGEVAYFNGGFDERWAALKPALHTIVVALEDCCGRGDQRVDLGPGAQPYKLRLADADDPLGWSALFPRDPRYPYTRVQALPAHARARLRMAARRLPPRTREGLRRVIPSGT